MPMELRPPAEISANCFIVGLIYDICKNQNTMKRTLVTIILSLLTLCMSAQTHLKFKGIPIEGSIDAFENKLVAQGYKQYMRNDPGHVLEGTFAGVKNCHIFIFCTQKTRQIWKAAVAFPSESSWQDARTSYDKFCAQFKQKYGEPTNTYEYFVSPYELDDGFEFQAISAGKGYYCMHWAFPEGDIAVKIGALNSLEGYVILEYEDRAGANLKNEEENSTISDDI